MWTTFSRLFGKSIARRMVDTTTWGRRPAGNRGEGAHLRDRISARDRHDGTRVEELAALDALTVPYYDGS